MRNIRSGKYESYVKDVRRNLDSILTSFLSWKTRIETLRDKCSTYKEDDIAQGTGSMAGNLYGSVSGSDILFLAVKSVLYLQKLVAFFVYLRYSVLDKGWRSVYVPNRN